MTLQLHARVGLDRAAVIMAVVTLNAGCNELSPVPTAPFEGLFVAVDTILLAEPDSAPITGIRDFLATDDGRFIVIDRARPEVRIFGGDGTLLRTIGRFGDGPGEFQRPLAAAMSRDGRLFIADGANGLLTRFTADLAYDTAFSIPGLLTNKMGFTGADDLFAVVINEPTPPHDFFGALLGKDGSLKRGFHDIDPRIWAVPYWPSFSNPVGDVGDARIVLGNNLFYPFRMYDGSGAFLREFGEPPPFWKEAAHPEAGAFTGADGFTRMQEWLDALTTISSVGIYRDSAVVVVHAEPRPQATDIYASTDVSLDVYDIDGIKLWEHVRVPGRILQVDRLVYILEREPPDPWTVIAYRLGRRWSS